MPESEQDASPKKTLSVYFERVWGQALMAMSTAEDEASKVLGRMADAAGWSPDEVRRQVREFSERLVNQRRDLEKNVEDRVKQTLSRLKVPRREELQELAGRLEALSKRIENLRSR